MRTEVAQQSNKGRTFSVEQTQWLGMVRDHIATSLEIEMDSFDLTPFTNEGGLARASKVFGKEFWVFFEHRVDELDTKF